MTLIYIDTLIVLCLVYAHSSDVKGYTVELLVSVVVFVGSL